MPKQPTPAIAHNLSGNTAGLDAEIYYALDILDDSIVIFDSHWRYQFINKSGWRILGRRRDSVIGHNVWELLPHLKATDFHQAALQAMDTQLDVEIEEFYPHRQAWFRTKFYPTKTAIIAQVRDVTELRLEQEMNSKLTGTLQEAMTAANASFAKR